MGNRSLKLASILLRIGLAFVFLYAAAASLMEPEAWIGYFPAFMQQLGSANLLLGTFSIIEIILALWLLSGKWIHYSALLAALILIGITIANISVMYITFRDVGLFFGALALAAIKPE